MLYNFALTSNFELKRELKNKDGLTPSKKPIFGDGIRRPDGFIGGRETVSLCVEVFLVFSLGDAVP